MKRIIIPFILCTLILITGGCGLSSDKQPEETTVNVAELQEKIDTLQDKLKSYGSIYDSSLRETIDKYCENYLSFEGTIDARNAKKIKDYLTPNYYDELISKPFNEGGKVKDDYVQSTAVDELYFENIDERLKHEIVLNETTVTAICYQSVIADAKTNSYRVVYKFNLKKSSDKWLISAVEILS